MKTNELGRSTNFSEIAERFWSPESQYCKRIMMKRGMSLEHIKIQASYMRLHILPYFQHLDVGDITVETIEDWLVSLNDTHLAKCTINHCLATLKVVMKECARNRIIEWNPAQWVEKLRDEPKAKGILTTAETQELLRDPDRYFNGNATMFTANLLAATSGMRLGEIQGLLGDCVHEDHIEVKRAWHRSGGLGQTKTRDFRLIPLTDKTSAYIHTVERLGFIFSTDGEQPYNDRYIVDALYRAMARMGIDAEERKRRNITFHSWRHYFNSTLREAGIHDAKIRGMTGHRTLSMQDRYTHFHPEDFIDVKKIQEKIHG